MVMKFLSINNINIEPRDIFKTVKSLLLIIISVVKFNQIIKERDEGGYCYNHS
jgi:hypothetical protein